ncbi:MAG: hypothetical protein PHQ84_05100, partial [Candidatus Omnitrophica bacterium]|nr:hypothetical protein [Candidatus Omnitrophota bacterium]
ELHRRIRFTKPVNAISLYTRAKENGGAEIRTLGGLTPTTVFPPEADLARRETFIFWQGGQDRRTPYILIPADYF